MARNKLLIFRLLRGTLAMHVLGNCASDCRLANNIPISGPTSVRQYNPASLGAAGLPSCAKANKVLAPFRRALGSSAEISPKVYALVPIAKSLMAC